MMKNEYCRTCPRDQNIRKNGLCTRPTHDNYPVRCGPPWTITKHKFVEGYCEIVTKAMKNIFHNMYFIDLFSGPGQYYHWPSGNLLAGSPLIASNYNFKKYFLNDIEGENIEALKSRLNKSINVEYIKSDANKAGDKINSLLPMNSLSFCFVDPDNMRQLEFSTLKKIVESRKVDLLINFPYDMSFKRGAKNIARQYKPKNAFDLFLGSTEWLEIFKSHNYKFSSELCFDIIKSYSNQFYKLGYCKPQDGQNNIEIIKMSKNRVIYFLLFLSKNPLGYKLWNGIVKYVKGENLKLDL